MIQINDVVQKALVSMVMEYTRAAVHSLSEKYKFSAEEALASLDFDALVPQGKERVSEAKKAETEAKKAEKEAKKAETEAKKAAKKAEMDAKKAEKEAEKEAKKKRGRPTVVKPVEKGSVGDDVIANLVLQAKQTQGSDEEEYKSSDEEKPKKEKPKRVKKDAETKKVDAEAKAEAKKVDAEAKAEAKKAKAEAKKEATRLAKAEAKRLAEAEATRLAEAEAKRLAEADNSELSEEEEEGGEIAVKKFTHDGVMYLRDDENVVYDMDTQDEIGKWNDATNSIDLF